jgi:hypothetical protein
VVFRGALHYPSESGGWQLGHVDLSEHLDKYHNREVVLIIVSGARLARRRRCVASVGSPWAELANSPGPS